MENDLKYLLCCLFLYLVSAPSHHGWKKADSVPWMADLSGKSRMSTHSEPKGTRDKVK